MKKVLLVILSASLLSACYGPDKTEVQVGDPQVPAPIDVEATD